MKIRNIIKVDFADIGRRRCKNCHRLLSEMFFEKDIEVGLTYALVDYFEECLFCRGEKISGRCLDRYFNSFKIEID